MVIFPLRVHKSWHPMNPQKICAIVLAEKMAGDITLSEKPGESLKKWRSNFEISQTDIANYLKVSPSVISDYESGRRKSPGTLIIKKIVESLLEIDMDRGSKKIHAYESILSSENSTKSIYSTYEYTFPIQLAKLVNLIEGEVIFKGVEKPLYGFSVIDSQRAILELSSHEFQKLYGWSTDRAMIFTKVSTGKSPMVAIRVTNLKPGAVVLHGLRKEEVEPGAVKMAEVDRIPLVATTMSIDQTVQLSEKVQSILCRGMKRLGTDALKQSKTGENMTIGIVSYGAYIPKYRIKLEEIARLWGDDAEALKNGLMVYEKSVPDIDEDTATIAVEAARSAMARSGINPNRLGAVYTGSESHPYAVKPTSTIVAQAIGAIPEMTAADFEFACKAGTAAVQACMGLVGSDMIDLGMAIGADVSQGAPSDALEYTAAAGGVACIIGRKEDELARNH